MFENVSASKCALSFFSGGYSYPRMPFWFWQRNVTYAVQLEAERERGPI